ncbi:MAG: CcmD family protein [Ignavibacteria bacterium]
MSFIEQNSYYVVLGVTLILWLGLFLYMLSVEKRIKKTEKE